MVRAEKGQKSHGGAAVEKVLRHPGKAGITQVRRQSESGAVGWPRGGQRCSQASAAPSPPSPGPQPAFLQLSAH